MKTITAFALSALIATQALAVDTVDTPPPPPPAPEVSDSGGSTDIGGVVGFIVGAIAVAVLIDQASKRSSSTVMHAPRQLVEPDDCLGQDGKLSSC